MHRSYLLLAVAGGFLSVQSARATMLYSDSFNYGVQDPTSTSGDNLGHNFPDGNPSGAVPAWIDNYSYGVQAVSVAGNLSYPGLQSLDSSSNSDMVQFRGLTSGNGVDHHFFDQSNNGGTLAYTSYTSGTIYYSLVLRVNNIGTSGGGTEPLANPDNGFAGGSNPSGGSFFAGLGDIATYDRNQGYNGFGTGDAIAPLLIRSGDNTQYPSTYQLGLGTTAATRFWEGTNNPSDSGYDLSKVHNIGDVLFLVVSYTMNPGDVGDVAKLWINPTPGSLESQNAITISAQVGVNGSTAPAVQAMTDFFIRNNPVEPDQGLQMDDLRIGTTWANVTPAAVPEPASLSLLGLGALALVTRRGVANPLPGAG